jgi:hypothetical protein
MILKRVAVAALLFCTICPVEFPQDDKETGNARQREVQANAATAREMRSDLEKMRTLLGQMQRNVAFVSAGDTPLKHQFQLEIEMWQLLLRDMEKRANAETQ